MKKSFTLSEVLIALVIIGVVAVITVPAVVNNVQSFVKEKRVANIRQKVSKGTDAMLASVGLTGYGSTRNFVNEFQKHFRIAKICENSDISDCWPTESVILNDEGKEWDISKTKTAKTLKMPTGETVNWDDTVGIVTLDGTSMIITYNTLCDISATDGMNWSEDSSSSNKCIAAIFDWNGKKKPNKYTDDVLSINAGGLGSECSVELGGACFGSAFKPTAISDCSATNRSALRIIYPCYYSNDYWAGAVEACGGVANMPTTSELQSLSSELWSGGKYDSEKAASIGLPTSAGFNVWASSEGSTGYAYLVYFSTLGSTRPASYIRSTTGSYALCRGD
ncbi:MAG: prepilin-type N-terminal cleavage/methylation domain-containing protein [Candidatus Gastranaerophilales bacterium]|nr:prepilin-type N-terminal cleavage/methylation domain-containing protein [Candidatus Gastranaerophilales bacterium]